MMILNTYTNADVKQERTPLHKNDTAISKRTDASIYSGLSGVCDKN